jgi:hypothetical protein
MTPDDPPTLKEEMSRLPTSSRPYKYVTIGVGVVFFLAMLYAVVFQWWLAAVELETPVRNFADYLHKHHIAAGQPVEMARSVAPPASKVYKLDVDGQTIWLCYFNPADERQKEALGQIHAGGTMTIDGKELPAKVREVVVLAGYDGSKKEAEILQAFADYETR